MKILIIRNDKLGDFVLSLPVYQFLKKSIPGSQLHALVPKYTSSLASAYPHIDKVIIDSNPDATLAQQYNLLKTLRAEQYDAIITLYSTSRIGLITFMSGVKYRLAPATKLAQIFYNHRLTQRRSKSLKPEYEYNLDLARQFLDDFKLQSHQSIVRPVLHFNESEVSKIRTDFCQQHNIYAENKFIFIHCGTGGSATNLNAAQYAELITQLNISDTLTFVITAGPGEIENAANLSSELKSIPHIVYHSTDGLMHFSKMIQFCDLFISASTGPLHIAGALNRPTAAFYQRRRSATPLRWQTLNDIENRLAFTPAEKEDESDLQSIDVKSAASEIIKKFLQLE